MLTDLWGMEQGSCLNGRGSVKYLQRGHLGWNQGLRGSGLRHAEESQK